MKKTRDAIEEFLALDLVGKRRYVTNMKSTAQRHAPVIDFTGTLRANLYRDIHMAFRGVLDIVESVEKLKPQPPEVK
jgi:hypothetical protein